MSLSHARLAEAANQLIEQLARLGTSQRAAWDRDYLHSDLVHLGVPIPDLRRAVNATRRRLPPLARPDALALADLLWTSNIYEHRQAAVHLLTHHAALLTPADLVTVEAMLRTAHTWALVDTLAVHGAGVIALQHEEAAGLALDRWAVDADFWLRRSALLALIPGIRAGEPDLKRLGRYADAMLEEPEFFIRKAIGWVLRETSRRDSHFVTAWVEPRVDHISGVTLREAVRRLGDADRTRLLDAYRRVDGN
ncbi:MULTISPECIES: DNA alkylation repair protein [unclassified Streptomyces]|uniref:DNA alkylation repair protein n=1 Tax=unclassified Streptomyces TaxID=2593676 RepID=UPI002E326D16|nr:MULTISPECIES: DNA alkylation repair protein [unclassified Streptomyces]